MPENSPGGGVAEFQPLAMLIRLPRIVDLSPQRPRPQTHAALQMKKTCTELGSVNFAFLVYAACPVSFMGGAT